MCYAVVSHSFHLNSLQCSNEINGLVLCRQAVITPLLHSGCYRLLSKVFLIEKDCKRVIAANDLHFWTRKDKREMGRVKCV